MPSDSDTGQMLSSSVDIGRVFADLRLMVFERGWLSSNNVALQDPLSGAWTLVDTGYDAHAAQTVALCTGLGGDLARIVNTHLHSDHCGGNAALQSAFGAETFVPEVSIDAVRAWRADRLTYQATGQTCRPFTADHGIAAGDDLHMGGWRWRAIAAPGHDPEALMFFQPDSRVLISGDALWESRLAIIFPELAGRPGFEQAQEVLLRVQQLDPLVVIPGHGSPFVGCSKAIEQSLSRIERFRADPQAHTTYARKALVMFRMMEMRRCPQEELVRWVAGAPVFAQMAREADEAQRLVRGMVDAGLLRVDPRGWIELAAAQPRL